MHVPPCVFISMHYVSGVHSIPLKCYLLPGVPMAGIIKLEDSGSLKITSVQKSDGGIYSCNATNIAGTISSNNSVLTVLGKSHVYTQ